MTPDVAKAIAAAKKAALERESQAFAKRTGAVREYRFHPVRGWKFDFAWPESKVALEVEGAVWTRGRHTRGKGFIKDMEKYNAGTLAGWRILRTTWKGMFDGSAEAMVLEALKTKKEA